MRRLFAPFGAATDESLRSAEWKAQKTEVYAFKIGCLRLSRACFRFSALEQHADSHSTVTNVRPTILRWLGRAQMATIEISPRRQSIFFISFETRDSKLNNLVFPILPRFRYVFSTVAADRTAPKARLASRRKRIVFRRTSKCQRQATAVLPQRAAEREAKENIKIQTRMSQTLRRIPFIWPHAVECRASRFTSTPEFVLARVSRFSRSRGANFRHLFPFIYTLT